jgi:hypothetical protein
METTIKHALAQATAADMVDVLLNDGIHPREISDYQRGQIISKWLSEGDNISEFGEVYNGFDRFFLVEISKTLGAGNHETAGVILSVAIGQSPYGGDILDLIVDKVELERECNAQADAAGVRRL